MNRPPNLGQLWSHAGAAAACIPVESAQFRSADFVAEVARIGARQGLDAYLAFYNARRPHHAHGGRTPDMIYYDTLAPMPAAA